MAMAMRDSVTVSMADDSSGVFSVMSRVNWVCVLTVAGTTSLQAGTSNTSSKVRASGRFLASIYALMRRSGRGFWYPARQALHSIVAEAQG